MSIVVKNELDPVYEIINLLYLDHYKDWKEDTIKELFSYGVDGESFFTKHYKIVEKYLRVFQKNKIATPEENYFFDDSGDHTLILVITLAVEYRQYMESGTLPDRMQLRSFLAYCLEDTDDDASIPDLKDMPSLPDEASIIEFLDTTDIKRSERWQMLELLRTPEKWLSGLFHMIQVNLPAYQKAVEAVSKPLEQLFHKNSSYSDPKFIKLAEAYTDHITVYASLVTPLLQAILYSNGYQGLLNPYLNTDSQKSDISRESLLRQLKALGDKSKLDIICELKKSRKYNLELSEALGLSPSTMSHHMGALLSCGFVTVEKKDGKVYYCIQENVIRNFLTELEKLIL
ncbi:MAG: winged helix-turn-helix domain-containing protein [Eubacteriales bacterium]|nr:winged helix-turn-helix domain-containing protein [Eubacteriales bacterium]